MDFYRIFRFLVSGGTSACVEYGSFTALIYFFHTAVYIAQPISFCCGLVTSYLLNKFWVFSVASKSAKKKEFILFIALGVTNLLVTTGMVQVMVDNIHLNEFIAKIIIMLCVACWNFIIFKKLIFKTES